MGIGIHLGPFWGPLFMQTLIWNLGIPAKGILTQETKAPHCEITRPKRRLFIAPNPERDKMPHLCSGHGEVKSAEHILIVRLCLDRGESDCL